MKATLPALLLAAGFAVSAPPTAVEFKPSLLVGDRFRKPVTLTQDLRTRGGQLLRKGTYDVEFSTVGGDKVQAVFFQGGVRKGETQGIIIIGGAPAHAKIQAGGGPHTALRFSDLGLGSATPHALRKQGDKFELAVGNQGSHQILISLLVPAAMVQGGVFAPPQKH